MPFLPDPDSYHPRFENVLSVGYDLQITDYVRVPGRKNGGKHAGEPLDFPGVTGMNPSSGSYAGPTFNENITWPYLEFLTASSPSIRPTYDTEGIAVDVTIRMR